MKNKKNYLFLLILLLSVVFPLCGDTSFSEEDYIVKAGDTFVLQIISVDTLQIATSVLPTGVVSLYPVSKPVFVAGITLKDAKAKVNTVLKEALKNTIYSFELAKIAPMNIHITGAVMLPGPAVTEEPLTLYDAILLRGGFLAQASRTVSVTRGNKITDYDLRKYLIDGDITQNPTLIHDDRVHIRYATDFATVFINNDTINYIDYIEITPQTSKLQDIIRSTEYRHSWMSSNNIVVYKNGEATDYDSELLVEASDSIFVGFENFYIYLTGNIKNVGRVPYNAGSTLGYYLNQTGGIENEGNIKKIRVIRGTESFKANMQTVLKPGDVVYVPESTISKISKYLGSVSVIASIVSTIVLIHERTKN